MVALEILRAEHERIVELTKSDKVEDWLTWLRQHPESVLYEVICGETDEKAIWERQLSLYRQLEKRFQIEIVPHEGPPVNVSAYVSVPDPEQRARSYVPRERVAGVERLRLELSIEAVKACITRIQNLGFSENEALLQTMREHVQELEKRLAGLDRASRGAAGRRRAG